MLNECNSSSTDEAAPRLATAVPEIRLRQTFAEQQRAVVEQQRNVIEIFQETKQSLSAEEKTEALKSTAELKKLLRAHEPEMEELRIYEELENIDAEIRNLPFSDDGTHIGQQFLAKRAETRCPIRVDHSLRCPAIYTAFHTEKGFTNDIAVNPSAIDKFVLANNLIHEHLHAFQMKHAPALSLNPNNLESRFVLHPLHWITADNLCERDAFAKQAYFNYLFSQNHPEVRAASIGRDLFTVEDYENERKICSDHREALVESAFDSMKRIKRTEFAAHPFEKSYHATAISNFDIGMVNRTGKGVESIFVSLEEHDFYQIGEYGVGPNSLGKYRLEPKFGRLPELLPYHQELLADIMKKYDIPPLESCPTFAQAKQQELASQRQRFYIAATHQQTSPALVPAFG